MPPQPPASVEAPQEREPIQVIPPAEPMNPPLPIIPTFFAALFVPTYYHRPETWVLLQVPVQCGGWACEYI